MKSGLFVGILLLSVHLCLVGPVAAEPSNTGYEQIDQQVPENLGTVPDGHKARYVLPFFTSETQSSSRSVTIVSVFNPGKTDCEVGMQFQYGLLTNDTCSISSIISPGTNVQFCSRNVVDPLTPCTKSCNLTFVTGHAFISSATACRTIAVDASLVYTSDVNDTQVLGLRHLNIVPVNKANVGD